MYDPRGHSAGGEGEGGIAIDAVYPSPLLSRRAFGPRLWCTLQAPHSYGSPPSSPPTQSIPCAHARIPLNVCVHATTPTERSQTKTKNNETSSVLGEQEEIDSTCVLFLPVPSRLLSCARGELDRYLRCLGGVEMMLVMSIDNANTLGLASLSVLTLLSPYASVGLQLEYTC